MKKIKVIHICDKFGVRGSSVHGVSRLFEWWFPRFDHEEFDIKLIGLRQADQAVEHLENLGIKILSLGRGKFNFLTILDLLRIFEKEDPDIVHLHGYGAANFGRIAAKLRKVKTIVHEHAVFPKVPIYQKVFDYLLSGLTNYSVAVSDSVRTFLIEKRYISSEIVETVYNGVPLKEFKKSEDPIIIKEEKDRWKINSDCKIIATIGRLDEQKGNIYFIEAADKIKKKGYNVKFMIVGDGPQFNFLKETTRKYGLENDFIFTGYHKNIPLIQSFIDIQVFPSLFEGTPLTLFEAMSNNLPIVSTNVDGLGEILIDGKNALVIPSKNSEKLASSLEKLLKDEKLKHLLSNQANVDVQKFDIQNTVNRLQEIYRKLLK